MQICCWLGLGRRRLCLSLLHPFILVKTLEHLLAERGGKKRKKKSHKELQHLCRYKKKIIMADYFSKKPKKTPLFSCKQAAFSLGSGPPRLSPACGEDKRFSRRDSGASDGRGTPGARRGQGCSPRHGAQARLTFQSCWL